MGTSFSIFCFNIQTYGPWHHYHNDNLPGEKKTKKQNKQTKNTKTPTKLQSKLKLSLIPLDFLSPSLPWMPPLSRSRSVASSTADPGVGHAAAAPGEGSDDGAGSGVASRKPLPRTAARSGGFTWELQPMPHVASRCIKSLCRLWKFQSSDFVPNLLVSGHVFGANREIEPRKSTAATGWCNWRCS